MSIPTAKVKLEILNIFGLPVTVMTGANTRYARATVIAGTNPQLSTGRSRPIPDAGGTFDLTSEAVPWVIEVNLNPGESVAIRVNIAQDLGDVAPPAEISLTGSVDDPWKGGVRIFGAPLGISVRVTTILIDPTDAGYLARAQAAGVSGALVVPQGFIVQFVDILGLYKPSPPAPPPATGSAHVVGYISDENLGRAFTNRVPDGSWKSDTQYIDAQLKVIAFGAPVIPAGAKIRWTLTDPDDPTNDSSSFHRDWGPYVDENDYGPAPFTPLGAHANDNALAFSPGNADESKLFGAGKSGNARWDTATGGPAPAASSSSQAESPLSIVNPKTATTSVRIHCPNVLGTNLIIKAELIGTPAGIPVHNASTGIITMWNRIDVEVKRMPNAFTLANALQNIPPFFLPACVQLDFQPEVTVPAAQDKLDLATSDTGHLEEIATAAWVNTVFSNKTKPGWFFLGSARRASPLPAGPRPLPIFEDTAFTLGTSGTDVFVQVNKALANPFFARFEWELAGKKQVASFSVFSPTVAGGKTTMFLRGNDVTPLFTGFDADGSWEHAGLTEVDYFPQHELQAGAATLDAGGFGVPSPGATLRIYPPGATFTAGMSPPVKVGVKPFFAGRTVIFTAVPSYASSFLPVPQDPVVARNPGVGTFAPGRDVYIAITFVNGRGETDLSEPFKFSGTALNDQFSVPSPTLSPWFSALSGANSVTGYNVYEADVAAGAIAPKPAAFKKVNAALVPVGTATLVNTTGTGAAPPAQNSAGNVPTIAVDHFDSRVISTVVHEFTHAFGMPHKCGYWNWRTPRDRSCCMNYFNTWLIGAGPPFHVQPNTVRKQGDDFCGRHLMEIRRVHLEKNEALKSLGW
jgi:hypothetical protein